jgi:myo-inositol-1(or 4)-monophosphatase
MPPIDPQQLLEIAKQAAALAATVHRSSLQSAIAVDTKQSQSDLVTFVDRESERIIVDAIRNKRPQDSIVGEEGTSIEGDSGVCWVIDPLDGTTNFVHGYPFHSVAIGVEINGLRRLGVVHDTFHDAVYCGTVGAGASCDGTQITPGSASVLGHSLIGTGFSPLYEVRAKQGIVLQSLLPMVRDLRRSGCPSLDICAVAAGKLDGFFESNLGRWDITAAAAIAEAAGAVVQILESPVLPSPMIVVANSSLCGELVNALKRCEVRFGKVIHPMTS